MLNLIFIFLLFFFILLFFYFFKYILKKQKLNLILIYFFFFNFYLFFYFFFKDVNLLYWIINLISQNGKKLITLGDGQELLYLLIEVSFFLTFFLFFPMLICFLFIFFSNVWYLNEKKSNKFLFYLFIYYYFLAWWLFYQDIGFSSWEIFFFKENIENYYFDKNLNFFWSLLDYQPQMEKVFFILKTELLDIFFWQFFIFTVFILYFYLFCFKRNWKLHFFFLLCFFLGAYFFWGGDGLGLDFFVLILIWILYEIWVFSFYTFFYLKKKRISFFYYWEKIKK